MNSCVVRKLLRAECQAAGGESVFARKIGVTPQLVNAVLIGTREPRGKILDALGLEAVIVYRCKKSKWELSNLKVSIKTTQWIKNSTQSQRNA